MFLLKCGEGLPLRPRDGKEMIPLLVRTVILS
jgi:hypothetical protein